MRITIGHLSNGKDMLKKFTDSLSGIELGLNIIFPIYEEGLQNTQNDNKKRPKTQYHEPKDNIQIKSTYLDIIQDEGLFRTLTTIHSRSFAARSADFSFDVNPFWKLKHEFVLKDVDGSLLQNFWSLCLNYEQ
jgi:hypothetical protein